MRLLCFCLSMVLLIGITSDTFIECVLPEPIEAIQGMEAEDDANGSNGKRSGSKAHKRSQFKRKT